MKLQDYQKKIIQDMHKKSPLIFKIEPGMGKTNRKPMKPKEAMIKKRKGENEL